MATTFTYPTPAKLIKIEQDLMPIAMEGRAIFDLFPMDTVNEDTLIWEQRDNYTGLMQIRGLNGNPPRVQPVGSKRYQMIPGVYGEYIPIDEAELTRRAAPASFTEFISLDDAVRERQDYLIERQLDRQEKICWDLVLNGVFTVAGPSGAILAQDAYTTQTYTATVPWLTIATSTPLQDFRNVQLLARGHSLSFGADATAYMNQVTLNAMLANTNPADLYGRRTQGLGTFNNLAQIQQLLMGDNLPRIEVYEHGYIPAIGSAWVPFIPNYKVAVIGKRLSGTSIGQFRMTRNASNPNMGPGVYTQVVDNLMIGVPPRKIEVHRDFNGGPVLYFPSAIVIMSV